MPDQTDRANFTNLPVSFWNLSENTDSLAIVDDCGGSSSYKQLSEQAELVSTRLPQSSNRTIGFLFFDQTIAAVTVYLAALRSGRHVPLLIEPDVSRSLITGLLETYQPDWIAIRVGSEEFEGYREAFVYHDIRILFAIAPVDCDPPNENLGLLLSTSGSTGSQKLVRLSYDSIAANADSIANYLGLAVSDRAVTTLPLAYSFGLSLLNSHLAAGASILLTTKTPLARDFWELLASKRITSLSGVPSQFAMFRRAKLFDRGLSDLRAITQAGGNLDKTIKAEFESNCRENGIQFFVMYGQTEAAPRISYVPPDRLGSKLDSIGIPIPGGSLSIDETVGELVYQGPNVMLGYAENRHDLARGDDLNGVLRTGDIGHKDDDGYFYITGRIKRFIKLSGARVNLDLLEASLTSALNSKLFCVGVDERLIVILPEQSDLLDQTVTGYLREQFNIFAGLVRVSRQPELLYLSNGKPDYVRMAHAAET